MIIHHEFVSIHMMRCASELVKNHDFMIMSRDNESMYLISFFFPAKKKGELTGTKQFVYFFIAVLYAGACINCVICHSFQIRDVVNWTEFFPWS